MACNNKDLLLIIVLLGEWILCWFLLGSLFHVVIFSRRISWTRRSEMTQLSRLAVGAGCTRGQLHLPPCRLALLSHLVVSEQCFKWGKTEP